MSLSALTKFILPPVLASATVFSVMTVPLSLMGDKPIVINFQERVIFGKLRDYALPYVVLATGLSLGAGISTIAISGWRKSSRKSTEVEKQISQLELQLQQKEELLKEFKLSETQMQVSGLNNFLDEQTSSPANNAFPTLNPRNLSQPVASQTYQPVEISPQQPQVRNQEKTSANATSAFASAQNFLGYTQPKNNVKEEIKQEIAQISQANKTSVTPAELEQLQRQIRDMMLQMQEMQDSLTSTSQVTNTVQKQSSENISINYDTYQPQQVRFN